MTAITDTSSAHLKTADSLITSTHISGWQVSLPPVAGLSIGTLAGLWLAFLGLEYGSPTLLDSVEIILYVICGAVYALHLTGIIVGIVGIIRKATYAKRCLIFSIIGCLYYSLILGFLLSVRV